MALSNKNEDRRKAERYLRLAATATDPATEEALRMLAAEYFDLAQAGGTPAVQQQQQIQPENPKRETGTKEEDPA